MPIGFRLAKALLLLCRIPWLAETRRILARNDVLRGPDSKSDFERPIESVPQSRLRTSSEIELMLGSDHINKIIQKILMPWLDGLFSELKIPDIEAFKVPGIQLVLHNLKIEKNELQGVQVVAHQASTGDLVTAITLEAHAHLIASLLIGKKGGNKLTLDVNDKMQIDVVLKRAPDEILHLSVIRVELLKDPNAKKKLLLAGENWANSAVNLAIRAASKAIWFFAMKGVNGWGKNPDLNFPLTCLLGIALGPSGGCSGSDYSYDGRLVNPPKQESKEMCRAVMDLKIKLLEISQEMSVHLVVGFEPWLEVTQLGPTDVTNSVQQTLKEWIGPIYRGRPIMYQSADGRSKPQANYKAALDACIRQEGECGSVFGEVNKAGRLEYRVGRTPFPVRDGADQWAKCANEGEFCHFTDDETLWGDPKTKLNMWDFDAHGGHTDAVRMMRLRFGAFETPTDYVEITAHDAGQGVPCRRDFFGLGLQAIGSTGFSKTLYCKRLTSPSSSGTKCTSPECLANGTCASEGVYCPLERPCVVLDSRTNSPILGFENTSRHSGDAKSSAFCIEEKIDDHGNRVCPSSPASKHCWLSDGQAPFTQPVKVIRRHRRSCTGPHHLSCYLDIVRSAPPPPLDFQGGSIPSSSISMSLPTAVLNSALATIYNTGILHEKVFPVPAVSTVGSLCTLSKGFLCLASMWSSIKDDTPIQLQLQPTAPGKVFLEDGMLLLSLALQLSIHVIEKKNLGLPVERMLLSKKKCVRKEGILRVSWSDAIFGNTTEVPRWVELENNIVKTYTVHGRGFQSEFAIDSFVGWSAERDAEFPLCIKLTRMFRTTHRLCSESPETTAEWFELISSKVTAGCDSSVYSTWGRSEAARLTFGVEARAGVEVEKSKYLCVRPDPDQEDIFVHIGKLSTRSSFNSSLMKAATGTFVRPLLNFIVETFGLLKPMLVWDLQSLAAGAGLKSSPPPYIEIRNNQIFVTGDIVYLDEQAEGDERRGGFQFNMSATNPCLRPGDIKPSISSRIGSAMSTMMLAFTSG